MDGWLNLPLGWSIEHKGTYWYMCCVAMGKTCHCLNSDKTKIPNAIINQLDNWGAEKGLMQAVHRCVASKRPQIRHINIKSTGFNIFLFFLDSLNRFPGNGLGMIYILLWFIDKSRLWHKSHYFCILRDFVVYLVFKHFLYSVTPPLQYSRYVVVSPVWRRFWKFIR